MSIVVTTPTGNIGSCVVRLLLQAGVRPTLIARNPSKISAEVQALSDVRQGDQTDVASIVAATKGASTLFWLNSPAHGSSDPIGDYRKLGENAATAVRENGIGRVVFLSSIGAELRHGAGVVDGLGQSEEILNATDASIVHLRPGFFFENYLGQLDPLRNGVLPVPVLAETAFPQVATRDIGDVVAARLLDASWSGRHTQGIHGPKDLSFGEAASILSEATGRKIEFVPVPDEAFLAALQGAGLTESYAKELLQLYVRLRSDYVPENARTEVTTTPTTLGAWAYANLRSAL